MMLSKKLGMVLVPAALVLAGCASNSGSSDKTANQQQAQAVQAQPLAVYQASNKQVKGYRAVKVSPQQTIYVSETPVFQRANVTQVDTAQDNQGRSFIVLGLDQAGKQALSKVPASRGFVTTVGGQVASLSGTRQNNTFLLQTRDAQTSNGIIRAAFPQQAAALINKAK